LNILTVCTAYVGLTKSRPHNDRTAVYLIDAVTTPWRPQTPRSEE